MMNKMIPALLLVLCTYTHTSHAKNLTNCRTFSLSLSGDARLSIDPRIEFFQVFNLVAGNPNINEIDTDYKSHIIDYFNRYKGHPSVQYLRANFLKFFNSMDAPYSLVPSLELDFTFRKELADPAWKEHQEIDSLLLAFSQFAEDTDFAKFFNSQSEFYSLLLRNTAFTNSYWIDWGDDIRTDKRLGYARNL